MASNNLLTQEQEEQIMAAITKAENESSGEVRVHIEDHCSGDALQEAAGIFHHLGMDQTQQKNGVLIYIAYEDHKAAVYAGEGINKKVDKGYWSTVLDILLSHFKEEAFAKGIENAVHEVADQLSQLYPPRHGDVDELSNEISYK